MASAGISPNSGSPTMIIIMPPGGLPNAAAATTPAAPRPAPSPYTQPPVTRATFFNAPPGNVRPLQYYPAPLPPPIKQPNYALVAAFAAAAFIATSVGAFLIFDMLESRDSLDLSKILPNHEPNDEVKAETATSEETPEIPDGGKMFARAFAVGMAEDKLKQCTSALKNLFDVGLTRQRMLFARRIGLFDDFVQAAGGHNFGLSIDPMKQHLRNAFKINRPDSADVHYSFENTDSRFDPSAEIRHAQIIPLIDEELHYREPFQRDHKGTLKDLKSDIEADWATLQKTTADLHEARAARIAAHDELVAVRAAHAAPAPHVPPVR